MTKPLASRSRGTWSIRTWNSPSSVRGCAKPETAPVPSYFAKPRCSSRAHAPRCNARATAAAPSIDLANGRLEDGLAVLDHDVEVDFPIFVLFAQLCLSGLERFREPFQAHGAKVLGLALGLDQARVQLANSGVREIGARDSWLGRSSNRRCA